MKFYKDFISKEYHRIFGEVFLGDLKFKKDDEVYWETLGGNFIGKITDIVKFPKEKDSIFYKVEGYKLENQQSLRHFTVESKYFENMAMIESSEFPKVNN